LNIEQARGEDYPEIMDFLLRCFRTIAPDHEPFEDIYPDLYQPTDESMGMNYIIRDGGRIVSLAGIFPLTLRMDQVSLRVAGIGGVATDPAYRGKGYMSSLMGHLKQEVIDRGYPVSWLTGERDRYAHFGWEKAGATLNIVISKLKDISITPWALTQLNLAEDSLDQVITARNRALIKGLCDEDTLRRKFSRLHSQVLEARSGNAYAYAVLNDKDKRLVEWGGDVRGFEALVKRAFHICGELRLSLPALYDEFTTRLLSFAQQYEITVDNMAIFDLRALLLAYEPYLVDIWPQGCLLELSIKDDSSSVCCMDSGKIVEAKDSTAFRISLDPLRMASFLFGPVRPSILLNLADNSHWLDSVFPLPFHMPWLWRV